MIFATCCILVATAIGATNSMSTDENGAPILKSFVKGISRTKCDPGWGVVEYLGPNWEQVMCGKCTKTSFTPAHPHRSSCIPCTQCVAGVQYTDTACTAHSDTMCRSCADLSGKVNKEFADQCLDSPTYIEWVRRQADTATGKNGKTPSSKPKGSSNKKPVIRKYAPKSYNYQKVHLKDLMDPRNDEKTLPNLKLKKSDSKWDASSDAEIIEEVFGPEKATFPYDFDQPIDTVQLLPTNSDEEFLDDNFVELNDLFIPPGEESIFKSSSGESSGDSDSSHSSEEEQSDADGQVRWTIDGESGLPMPIHNIRKMLAKQRKQMQKHLPDLNRHRMLQLQLKGTEDDKEYFKKLEQAIMGDLVSTTEFDNGFVRQKNGGKGSKSSSSKLPGLDQIIDHSKIVNTNINKGRINIENKNDIYIKNIKSNNNNNNNDKVRPKEDKLPDLFIYNHQKNRGPSDNHGDSFVPLEIRQERERRFLAFRSLIRAIYTRLFLSCVLALMLFTISLCFLIHVLRRYGCSLRRQPHRYQQMQLRLTPNQKLIIKDCANKLDNTIIRQKKKGFDSELLLGTRMDSATCLEEGYENPLVHHMFQK